MLRVRGPVSRVASSNIVSDLRERYPAVEKDLLAPLLDLLMAARNAFDGDLDKFMIFTVVALRTAEHRQYRAMCMEQIMAGCVTTYPSLGTNVRSISESTGIARETVRRKVAELLSVGWIDRRGDDLSMTVRATADLAMVRGTMLSAAARIHLAVGNAGRSGEHGQ